MINSERRFGIENPGYMTIPPDRIDDGIRILAKTASDLKLNAKVAGH